MEEVVACALVTQRARVGCPVGTSFLGEVFSGFFLTCKTNVRKFGPASTPVIILYIIIIQSHIHPSKDGDGLETLDVVGPTWPSLNKIFIYPTWSMHRPIHSHNLLLPVVDKIHRILLRVFQN